MSTQEPLTTQQVLLEVRRLEYGDVDAAEALYRRAFEAGCAYEGLATGLVHLQPDNSGLEARLYAINPKMNR